MYRNQPNNGGGWNGGFGNVQPNTLFNGGAIGNYNPGFEYPNDHPYHHSNFEFNGNPIGPYSRGEVYPEGHPYHDHHTYF